VALVGIGDCFERGSLASATAALNAAYHVGNIVGPAAAGLAMDRFGPAALPATTLAVAGALTIALAGLFHVGRAATPRTSTHFLP
jgi:predicted MFS family arabinose efflux permease